MIAKAHHLTFASIFPKRVYATETIRTNFANKIICGEKVHTIRKTNTRNYAIGDRLICHSWEGLPYRSKNPIFITLNVEKLYSFKKVNGLFYLNDNVEQIYFGLISEIASNDGLKLDEFLRWFGDDNFSGQIISWYNNLMYA